MNLKYLCFTTPFGCVVSSTWMELKIMHAYTRIGSLDKIFQTSPSWWTMTVKSIAVARYAIYAQFQIYLREFETEQYYFRWISLNSHYWHHSKLDKVAQSRYLWCQCSEDEQIYVRVYSTRSSVRLQIASKSKHFRICIDSVSNCCWTSPVWRDRQAEQPRGEGEQSEITHCLWLNSRIRSGFHFSADFVRIVDQSERSTHIQWNHYNIKEERHQNYETSWQRISLNVC
jgi:hypothetical protein